jgi:hypothetical protein
MSLFPFLFCCTKSHFCTLALKSSRQACCTVYSVDCVLGPQAGHELKPDSTFTLLEPLGGFYVCIYGWSCGLCEKETRFGKVLPLEVAVSAGWMVERKEVGDLDSDIQEWMQLSIKFYRVVRFIVESCTCTCRKSQRIGEQN